MLSRIQRRDRVGRVDGAFPVIVVTGAGVDKATLEATVILRKPVLPEHVLPIVERRLRVA